MKASRMKEGIGSLDMNGYFNQTADRKHHRIEERGDFAELAKKTQERG